MARIRTVKPELFAHEGLFDLEQETGLPIRLAWVALFTVADREGRFSWRPRTLKAACMPHDSIDFSRVLHACRTRGLIVRYRVGTEWYGCIPTWRKHQVINNREAPSVLPGLDDADEVDDPQSDISQELIDASATRDARIEHACPTPLVHAQGEGKGKGKEGKGKEIGTRAPRVDPVSLSNLPEWAEWIARRKVKRWPIDPTTLRKQLAVLAPHDAATQAEIINTSIQAGWQGLFPPKGNSNGRRTDPDAPGPFEIAERRLRRLAAEAAERESHEVLECAPADVRDAMDDELRSDPIGDLDLGDREPERQGAAHRLPRAAG